MGVLIPFFLSSKSGLNGEQKKKKWHAIERADGWEVLADGWEVLSLVLGSVLVIFLTVVTKCLTQSSVKREGLVLAHSLACNPSWKGRHAAGAPAQGTSGWVFLPQLANPEDPHTLTMTKKMVFPG